MAVPRRKVFLTAALIWGVVCCLVTTTATAQTGRIFNSVEAYAGLSRILYVGKITVMRPIEYTGQLTETQRIGKPYHLTVEVAETIRGDEVPRLELVLSLQTTVNLQIMRDRAARFLLAAGPVYLDHYPMAEIGILERGKPVTDEWYHFRLLDPVTIRADDDPMTKELTEQLNKYYDSCRMFTVDYDIVTGGEKVLPRVREFVKLHPPTRRAVLLNVPNSYGALCGDPNAYCMIRLPCYPETKASLAALQRNPDLILKRINSPAKDEDRRAMQTAIQNAAEKALADFPQDSVEK